MNPRSERPSKQRTSAATPKTARQDDSSVYTRKTRIRVLIADDHDVVREGLVSMIQRNKADMTVVGEASNGRQAVRGFAVQQRREREVGLVDFLQIPQRSNESW
jgi:PleD family two-component response regulator